MQRIPVRVERRAHIYDAQEYFKIRLKNIC